MLIKPPLRQTGFVSGLAAATTALALLTCSAGALAQSQSMQVTKDPVTGQLRTPTPEERKALEGKAALRKAAPRGLLTGSTTPQAVRHANGMVMQELDESSLSYSVAVRKPDGTLATTCVTGADAAAQALKGKPTTTLAKEHRHEEHK